MLSTVKVVLGPAAGAVLPTASLAVPAAMEIPMLPSPVIPEIVTVRVVVPVPVGEPQLDVQRRVVRVARDLGLELADGRLLRLLRQSLAPRDRECERNGCREGSHGPPSSSRSCRREFSSSSFRSDFDSASWASASSFLPIRESSSPSW